MRGPEGGTTVNRRRLRLAGIATAITVGVIAVPLAAGTAAAPIDAAKVFNKKTITMSGSTSVAPLAAKLASKYIKKCHGCVQFRLLQGGSDVGISDVAAGAVTIGNSSRDPKPSDPGGLVFNKIAKDAICVITNKSNPLPDLSQETIQAIFGGTVRNWSGVPGSTIDGTIDVIVRTPASGTQDAFQKIFMGSTSVFSGASAQASNGLVQQKVQSDPPTKIGYVSLHFAEGTSANPYKGVACTLENAKSGTYPGLRNFYMVTKGDPKGRTKKFIHWVQHSKKAAKITATEWVPLR
jgi:phosphate transport system substrate-binding protein